MTDGAQERAEPFRRLDSKLTVFALANGMDLSKGEDYRRLEWFSDGLERGILIHAGADGFDLTVMAWKTKSPENRTEQEGDREVDLDAISGALTAAIDTANQLGAPA